MGIINKEITPGQPLHPKLEKMVWLERKQAATDTCPRCRKPTSQSLWGAPLGVHFAFRPLGFNPLGRKAFIGKRGYFLRCDSCESIASDLMEAPAAAAYRKGQADIGVSADLTPPSA